MLCQLMMGFYALVEDGDIKVDGSELEGMVLLRALFRGNCISSFSTFFVSAHLC